MLSIVGIGPSGHQETMLPSALQKLRAAEVVIGYEAYVEKVRAYLAPKSEILSYALSEEGTRAQRALREAKKGKKVVVLSSGDAGVYGMASLVLQTLAGADVQEQVDIEVEVVPGVSAFQTLSARVGAAIGHDFCCISLSNLLTPWPQILQRLTCAAQGNFVAALYNPRSSKRTWQLQEAKSCFLRYRPSNTPVAIGRHLGSSDEQITLSTLKELPCEEVDMFSTVLIGNSDTFRYKNYLVTPRGYSFEKSIQAQSFKHVLASWPKEERNACSAEFVWAALRCIHSTGQLDIKEHLLLTPQALYKWHQHLRKGGTIVTDVEMVRVGISRHFVQKYGTQVRCGLNDEEVTKESSSPETRATRAQLGMRKAAQEYPEALFVVGSAPTALIELLRLFHKKQVRPAGIVATPVGFVNVLESKAQLTQTQSLPYALVQGHRGGSSLGAAIVNAAFSLEELKAFL